MRSQYILKNNNLTNSSITTLTPDEIDSISGGFVFATAIATVGVGYMIHTVGLSVTLNLIGGITTISALSGFISSYATYGDLSKAFLSAEEKVLFGLTSADLLIFVCRCGFNFNNSIQALLKGRGCYS